MDVLAGKAEVCGGRLWAFWARTPKFAVPWPGNLPALLRGVVFIGKTTFRPGLDFEGVGPGARGRYPFALARASSHSSRMMAASCAGGRLSALARRMSSLLADGVSRIVSVSVLFSMPPMYALVRFVRNVYVGRSCVLCVLGGCMDKDIQRAIYDLIEIIAKLQFVVAQLEAAAKAQKDAEKKGA